MAQIALMARTMVAAARIVVDHPKFNQHSNLSKEEVRANYAERWFMEAGGTFLQHAAMYGAMQGMSRWFEKGLEKPYHQVLQTLKSFPVGVQEAFIKHFGQGGEHHPTRGLIHRATFHGDSFRPFKTTTDKGISGSLRTFFESARPHLNEQGTHTIKLLEESIQPFSKQLLRRVAATPLFGVVAGCITGGVLIQLLNDRVFRPFVTQWLGVKKKPVQNLLQSTPAAPSPYTAPAASTPLQPYQRFSASPNPLAAATPIGGGTLW